MSLRIDDDLKDRIAAIAGLREVEAETILREALTEYVMREEARGRFVQEALASSVAYETDGLHLTGDEVSAWLRDWGLGADAEMPEYHG